MVGHSPPFHRCRRGDWGSRALRGKTLQNWLGKRCVAKCVARCVARCDTRCDTRGATNVETQHQGFYTRNSDDKIATTRSMLLVKRRPAAFYGPAPAKPRGRDFATEVAAPNHSAYGCEMHAF